MAKTLSIHSFRGGTGKSNISANIATILALEGKRVAVIDTDIQSPGIHVLFGLSEGDMTSALNDYLYGRCEIRQAAYDVTARLDAPIPGAIYLIPSSIRAGDIARVLREGYDVELLTEGFRRITSDLSLDVLMIDTHPGLNEETLLSIALSDSLGIVLRPDQQDFQGTSVTVEVARKLGVPRMTLVLNKVPSTLAVEDLKRHVAETYQCSVAAAIPHSDEMMSLGSGGIFALRYPDDPVTAAFRQIATVLLGT
ncbi:MAG TPA: MinD/ParA family protein [Thermoanaerobaculia bacterium]|nr:MinD/ParA family protein [Thermoanaerobaculia bacterium]